MLPLHVVHLVKVHEEAVGPRLTDSGPSDPVVILPRTNTSRYSSDVHARVGPATPAPGIRDLEGAELVLAPPSPLVDLSEDVKGANVGETVQSFQEDNLSRREELGTHLDNSVDYDEFKGRVPTGPFAVSSVVVSLVK